MKRRDFLKVSSGGLGLAMLPNISLGNVDPEATKLYYEMLGTIYTNNVIPHNITKIQAVVSSIIIYYDGSDGLCACGRFCDTITENMSKVVKRLLYNHIEYLKNTYTKKDFELVYYWIKLLEKNMGYCSIKYKDIINVNVKPFEFENWDLVIPFISQYGIIDIKTNYDNMAQHLYVFASHFDSNPQQQLKRCIKLLKTILNHKTKIC